jgi:hypothetical protein
LVFKRVFKELAGVGTGMAGIEGLAGIALGEFPCQLDALGLAAGQRGRILSQG